MKHDLLFASLLLLSIALGSRAAAVPSTVERLSPEVYVVRDDLGAWGGGIHGITHQRGPDYWAKNVLDLSAVPEKVWQSSSRVRLSAFFTVRDYSWHDTKTTNGLDESFEIVINGKPHVVADNSGVPVFLESRVRAWNWERCFRWHDFEIPKSELVRGPNEIIFRRVRPSGKNPDDFLYLGIDNSVPGRNSWVRFGRGQPWRQDRITMPDGGTGEYMVRLYLFSRQNELAATWRPGGASDAPQKLFDYAGARDFVCRSITPLNGKPGFRAVLACSPIGLEATFSAWIDDELRMSLNVTNRGAKPLSFKLAFPHLAGLALSEKPSADYYHFPWGGGIISDAPAVIRRGYGDYAALYQVMDLFSPSRGAGLMIRSTDEDGRHKVLALRKHIPGEAERNGDAAQTPTSEEFKWTNPLAPVPGVSVAYECLRRCRGPGESFAAKDAALRAHAGDWHAALRAYADWCHRVWKFRPYPSRLTPVVCIMGPGWAQNFLFRDGEKTFYTLLNAPGHSYAGPVLSLDVGPGAHVFDLLRGREAEPHRGRQASEIRTFLVRDDVTCLAKMPARLAVKAAVGAIEIAVRDARPAWQVHLCNAEGKSLLSAVAGATTRVSLVELGAKGKTAVYLKLMDGPGCSMPSPCPTDMETRTMSACPDRRLVGSPISPENGRKCCTMTTGRNTSRASAILCGRNLRSYLPDRRLPFDGWCSFSRCPSLRPALVSRRCRRTCSTMARSCRSVSVLRKRSNCSPLRLRSSASVARMPATLRRSTSSISSESTIQHRSSRPRRERIADLSATSVPCDSAKLRRRFALYHTESGRTSFAGEKKVPQDHPLRKIKRWADQYQGCCSERIRAT